MKFYLLFASLVFFDIVSFVLGRLWGIRGNAIFLALTVLSFGITGYFLARTLAYQNMAVVNAVWAGAAAILTGVAGYFFFHDTLKLQQVFGIIAVIIGITLIELV